MKRTLLTLAVVMISMILMTTSFAWAGSYFDTTNLSKGLVGVTYTSTSTAKMKVMIEKDTKRYTYDVNAQGIQENFPLQLGNGTYKVSLFQNTSGTSYRLIASDKITLNLQNPNVVYLNSVQNINWNIDSEAVAKAVALTKDTPDLQKKAKLLWAYMAKNNSYDYKKLATLKSSYVPSVDATLRDKTGICYDFSALYAAMLRSQGIPAKLVKGYAPNYAQGYHAWNEAYDAVTKQWITIDSTYDLQVIKAKPAAVTMAKKTSEYQKTYEY